MNNSTEESKKIFIVELINSLNNITVACQKTGIGRTTYYLWVNTDPEFVTEIKRAEEEFLDWLEQCAKDRILKGSDRLLELYLKKKGKSRGFGDEQINQNITFELKIEDEDDDSEE